MINLSHYKNTCFLAFVAFAYGICSLNPAFGITTPEIQWHNIASTLIVLLCFFRDYRNSFGSSLIE